MLIIECFALLFLEQAFGRFDHRSIDFPMVNIAMFDAVNAIDRRYTTYIARPTTDPQGASQEAAAIAAAYTVLRGNIPSRRAQLDASYASSYAALPAGEARDAISQTNGTGLIVGPGCVLRMNTPDSNVAAVVQVLGGPLKKIPGVTA